MSGSELAPFVAAAIRDKVVTEMAEEIHQLRASLQCAEQIVQSVWSSDVITITGRGGSPIYAVGNLSDACAKVGGRDAFGHPVIFKEIALTNYDATSCLTMCPIRELENTEVHRDGELLFAFSDVNMFSCPLPARPNRRIEFGKTVAVWDEDYEYTFRLLEFSVVVEYGPIPLEQRDISLETPFLERNEDVAEVKFISTSSSAW